MWIKIDDVLINLNRVNKIYIGRFGLIGLTNIHYEVIASFDDEKIIISTHPNHKEAQEKLDFIEGCINRGVI